MPSGPTMIAVIGSGGHLSFVQFSLIAVRDSAGVWTIDRVGQLTRDPAFNVAPEITHANERLDPDRGRLLDAIITNPCLYVEATQPTPTPSPPPLGTRFAQVDVATPFRRHSASTDGTTPGLAARLWELLA